ncbi:MAG: glycosyltransferase [Chloroflexota bacterium]
MTKVLMFGYGPLPIEGLRMTGPGLRTWHFLTVLLEAGHEVCLIGDRIHGIYPADLPDVVSQRKDNWIYHSVSDMLWHNPAGLRPLIDAFGADCAISVTTPASAIGAEMVGELPMWADLYGSVMAEAQLKALVYGDDAYLSHFWTMERKAIERGDIFSTVSERQQWSLIGELGMWGRLNQWTSGYEFATTIPIASETTPYTPTKKVIRGILAKDKDFVILYAGGYNTWTDVDTMFNALEIVMCQHPEVEFVSTGGKIEGHDDMTYMRFKKLIESSPYRDRYHLQGWVPNDDVPNYYLESNLGINSDRTSYEALLGSRTRVLDWMRAELPCVMSSLTELSAEVVAANAGLAYQPENTDDLVRCLMQCVSDPAETAEMGKRGRELLLSTFTYEATSKHLLKWVEKPSRAPDTGKDVPKLVRAYQNVGTQIAQGLERRSLGFSLALAVWPYIARVTTALGLQPFQRKLAAFGLSMLRLERSPYKAVYLNCEVPKKMRAGDVYEGTVNLRNKSATSWLTPTESDKAINLSYHWVSEQGTMILKEGLRSKLPEVVKTDKTVVVPFRVAVPDQPGRYRLELDLVREGVTWFSEAGSPGPSFLIDVSNS